MYQLDWQGLHNYMISKQLEKEKLQNELDNKNKIIEELNKTISHLKQEKSNG